MEYRYRSVPRNCSLLETARSKPIYGEYLESYGFGEAPFEELAFRASDADFLEYIEQAKRIRESFPGIEIRCLELGPERESLRKAILDSQNSLLTQAIDGGEILRVDICSTQGEPIRFLQPDAVNRIVKEFDSGRFLVSSIHADVFGKLADFYRFSAAFDEGVITIKL